MKGSTAEEREIKIHGRPEEGRSGAGYRLKPSEENGRSAIVGRRSGTQGWELRLGKLQLVVWLGLALGSIVGAYCVGFFSGRYVGFETARESSAIEVAKLPVTDVPAELTKQNPQGIYDKLNAPAILKESDEPPAGKENGTNSGTTAGIKQPRLLTSPAEVAAAAINSKGDAASVAKVADSQSEPDIFEDLPVGGEVIIGADTDAVAAKAPESVRMLGSNNPSATKGENTKDKMIESARVADSADELLDQRIASARTEPSKDPIPAGKDSLREPETIKKTAESGPLVRKVVSSGYFAQVAAPKKMNEAQTIAQKLKKSGFPVVIEPFSNGGQSFYRVLVGPEENKVQADRLVSQLKGERYLPGAPFIRKYK